MLLPFPVLLLCSLFTPAFASCDDAIALTEVFEKTYDSLVTLVRYGIPSEIACAFYVEALSKITEEKCICQGPLGMRMIDMDCYTAVFAGHFDSRIRRLNDIILADEDEKLNMEEFPLYQANKDKELPATSAQQDAIIERARVETKRHIENYVRKGSKALVACALPPDEEIVWDPDGEELCKDYSTPQRSVPATLALGYAIGLASQMRFALVKGRTTERTEVRAEETSHDEKVGPPHAIEGATFQDREVARLLELSAMEVFKHLRCQRKVGNELRIPAEYMTVIVDKAKIVIAKYGALDNMPQSLPAFEDLFKMALVPYGLFMDDLRKLGSYESFGRAVILSTDGKEVYIKAGWKRLKEVSIETYSNYYDSALKELRGPTSYGVECLDGWKYVPRLVPVSHPREKCCSEKCLQSSGSVLDVSVVLENCCQSCNAYRCPVQKFAGKTEELSSEMNLDVTR